ncbi:MAG: hypothetical protein ACLUUO_05620 [Sellimonas intestinalis]
MRKIKTVIDQFCIQNHRGVLIPTFSLDRTPFILWELYQIWGNDPNFSIPILVDSPLANRLLDCYGEILEGEAKVKFDEMMQWKNIQRIISPEESKAAVSDPRAKVISKFIRNVDRSHVASNGHKAFFLVKKIPSYLSDMPAGIRLRAKSRITKIKKRFLLMGNRSRINVRSLICIASVHICNERICSTTTLLLTVKKIYLVHSDKTARLEFKEDLQEEIRTKLKTTKVVAVNYGTKISL